jgi:hypothetical protein
MTVVTGHNGHNQFAQPKRRQEVMMQQEARVIVAIAAEADDKSIWSQLKMLPELFAAGPVAIRVGFFGAEGARSSRPFMVSRWTTDADDLADLLEKARTRCICGC